MEELDHVAGGILEQDLSAAGAREDVVPEAAAGRTQARDLGLDVGAFRACLDDPATLARVGEDVAAASRVGVTSTPTIFFNGRTIEGALDRNYYDYAFIIERHSERPGGAGAS